MEGRRSLRFKGGSGRILFLGCILLLTVFCSSSTLAADADSDYSHERSLMDDEEIQDFPVSDPCTLPHSDNPGGMCYCEGQDGLIGNCWFQRNPSAEEWAAIGTFRSVNSLNFNNRPTGAIKEFPPTKTIDGLRNLLYFVLRLADVDNIPSFAFGNSTSIAEIDLKDNNIRSLSPYAFANLNNLTSIKLNENKLTEVNKHAFSNLLKLRELVLSKNQIQVVHDFAFSSLPNLHDLALQNNNLTVISREIFAGLSRMRNLDLQANTIEYIGDHAFAEMPGLQDLDLNRNMIKSVSSTAFAGLRGLMRLNLRNNKIVMLHPATFNHLNMVYFLDLRSNELESLSYELMRPIFHSLKSSNMQLYVEGNRFVCDCHLLWMAKLYEETESSYVKRHINGTTCNLFVSPSRHVAESTSSTSIFHKQPRDNTNVTLLTSPLEETTTYAFESVKDVVALTAEEFNCKGEYGEETEIKKQVVLPHDFQTHQHHEQHQTGRKPNQESGSNHHHGHKQVVPTSWDANTEGSSHHQRPYPHKATVLSVGEQEDSTMMESDETSQHDTALHEPQATAALEGVDVGVPKSTSSADHKVDNSRTSSSTHTGLAADSASSKLFCDSVLLIGLLGCALLTALTRI